MEMLFLDRAVEPWTNFSPLGLEDIELTPKASFETVLRELCGLLVTIIDDRIYLLHQTVKDFLQKAPDADAKSSDALQWKNSLDRKESHNVLAWSCARYLFLDDFEDGLFTPRDADIFNIVEPQDAVLGVVPTFGNPFGRYRLHRRARQTAQGTDTDTNGLKNLPTPNRIVEKKLANHPFLGYTASYWYPHYVSSGAKDSFKTVLLTLWQLTTPRGRLWFTVRGHLLRFPRLPAILWRNFGPLVIHACLGHAPLVEKLLLEEDDSTESQNQVKLALQLAIMHGSEDVVRNIVKEKQEITKDCLFQDFSTPVSCAIVACYPKIVQILLQSGHTLGSYQNIFCDLLRDIGAKSTFPANIEKYPAGSRLPQDSANVVIQILKAGGNINQQSVNGEFPLGIAVQQWNFEGVRALLDSDSGPLNIFSKNRGQASTAYPKVDLKERLNINAQNEKGYSFLHLIGGTLPEFPVPGDAGSHEYFDFCMVEQHKIVSYLLAKGADPNLCTAQGITPIHFAVASHRLEIIEELIKKKANINAQRDGGFTPLHDLWLCRPVNPPDDYKPSFKTKCTCCSTQDILRVLIKHGVNIEAEDSTGCTPLLSAASKQSPFIFRSLMEVGANINAQDQQGNTCLHLAVGDFTSLVEMLCYPDHLKIDVQNSKSRTALHIATELGDLASMILLLACGADASLVDDRNWTPLHVAMNRRCYYSVWLLLMAQSVSHALTLPNGGTIMELAHNMAEELSMLQDFEMPDTESDFYDSDGYDSDGYDDPLSIHSPSRAQSPLAGSNKPVESRGSLDEPQTTSQSTPLKTRFTRGSMIPPASGQYRTGSHPASMRPVRPWKVIRPAPVHRTQYPNGHIFDDRDLRTDYFLLREDLSDASDDLDIASDTESVTSDSSLLQESRPASSISYPGYRRRTSLTSSSVSSAHISQYKRAPIHKASSDGSHSGSLSMARDSINSLHYLDELSREKIPATDTNKDDSDQEAEKSDSSSQPEAEDKHPTVTMEDISEMQATQTTRSHSTTRADSSPTSQLARSLSATSDRSLSVYHLASSSDSHPSDIQSVQGYRRGSNSSVPTTSEADWNMDLFCWVGTRCVSFAQDVCDIATSYQPGRDLVRLPPSPARPSLDFGLIDRVLKAAQSLPVTPESEELEARELFFTIKNELKGLRKHRMRGIYRHRHNVQWFESSILHPSRRISFKGLNLSRESMRYYTR